MLPTNHKVTAIVKEMNEGRPSPAGYVFGLSSQERNEYVRVLAIHQAAKERYRHAHPRQARATAPMDTAFFRPEPLHRAYSSTQEPVVNVYVYDNRPNSLWYDWWCWRMLTWDMMYSRPYPAPHRHPDSSKRNNNEPNAAQILLAIVCVLGAAVSTLYSFIEIGRCIDKLAYAEDVFGSLSRIALGLLGAVAGGFAGFAFGAGVLGCWPCLFLVLW